MHRATPLNSSFRGYTAGGARSAVNTIDDGQLMQAMGGNFMHNESRQNIEAPQNYGFTSVVMEATKDGLGAISDSAEAVISFMGGNRSFPVAGVMDDRRHRLFGMQPGDSAMFSTKGRKQQIHMNEDGMFLTATRDKTARLQLLDEDSESDQQQQQGGSSAGTTVRIGKREFLFVSSPDKRADIVPGVSVLDAGGGGSGSSGGGQQKGQKPRYKDAQNSYRFVDVTQNETRVSGNEAHLMLQDGDSYVHCASQKTYLGGRSDKHSFAPVATTAGPSVNVFARIGSLDAREEDAVIIGEIAPSAPKASASSLLPILMLLLGLSVGINYTLVTDAWASALTACRVFAMN
jgi:Bacteriophage Mu Gp45 spike protein